MPQSKTPESYPEARGFLNKAVEAKKGWFAIFESTDAEVDQIRIEANIRVVEAVRKFVAILDLKDEFDPTKNVSLPTVAYEKFKQDMAETVALVRSTFKAADAVSKELSALSKATYFRNRLYSLRNAERKRNRASYTPDQALYNRTEWDVLTFTQEFLEPGRFRVCAVHDDEAAMKLIGCESGELS